MGMKVNLKENNKKNTATVVQMVMFAMEYASIFYKCFLWYRPKPIKIASDTRTEKKT